MAPRSRKGFKDLQVLWYQKLKDAGFEDIENTRIEGAPLVYYHSHRFATAYNPLFFSQRQEYYRLAGIFLYHHEFDSSTERSIWELHSEGLSIAKIAIRLKVKAYVAHRAILKLSQLMLKEGLVRSLE